MQPESKTIKEPRRHFHIIRGVLIFSTIFALGFAYGAVVGFYKIRPVGLLYKFNQAISDLTGPAESEAQYLDWAFSDPLPDGRLLNAPIDSIDSLAEQLNNLYIVPNDAFLGAYETVTVGDLTHLEDEVVELQYYAGGKMAKANAYFRASAEKSDCGALLIPESGHNKSSETLARNGFGIADVCDTYVLIKPNEDNRALHDGKHKLRREMIIVGMLRRGYSYSVTYLVEALAFAKYLNGRYEIFGVAGLSQGGEAALLVSLQSKPDFAVIASGFSVIQWQATMAEFDQIIIPGLYDIYTLDHLKEELSKHETQYLFTYGKQEHLYYGLDVRTCRSCEFLDSIESQDITCIIHDGGHTMPMDIVVPFISKLAMRK